MWDRRELKAKGKAAYRANRVACIIAAFLLMIASGAGGAVGSAGSSWSNVQKNMNDDSNYTQDIDDFDDYDADDDSIDFGADDTSNSSSLLGSAIIAVIIVVVLVALVFGLAIGALLLNPLQVGVQKFFIDNATDQTTGLHRDNIGLAFGENYKKIVLSMFTTGLFTALWCLLLIIPGIYKAYCWRLVPYIVSEDPTITGTEARERSAILMSGSKWDSFVLDLSFLGWKILGAFTLGILNIVFTNPYQAATNAELYLTLSGRPSELAAPAESKNQYAPDVDFVIDQENMNE